MIKDGDVNVTTVQSTGLEATNECTLSCKDTGLICDDDGANNCKCHDCRPTTENMLVKYNKITLASESWGGAIISVDVNNARQNADYSSTEFSMSKDYLNRVLKEDFDISLTSGMTSVSIVCMNDVNILQETKSSSKSTRYYILPGKIEGIRTCPSIGYNLTYSSPVILPYLSALARNSEPGLASIQNGIDITFFG